MLKLGDKISQEIIDKYAVEIPGKKILNAGFRVLTDTMSEGNTLTRIDVKINDKQLKVVFNSSKVGQSLLKMPEGLSSLAVNVNKEELIENLENLIKEIKNA